MLTYVIPTRDRHEELRRTVGMLGALGMEAHAALGGAEVVVVDNDSPERVGLPSEVGGMRVRVERLGENLGAAARNVGAETAGGEWVVMLDDDSAPLDTGFVGELAGMDAGVGAVCADIVLSGGGREAGGLPEVPVGCGVAYRRGVFLGLGGYDASFGYYAEEYDLAAKLLRGGYRVVHSAGFRVEHRKVVSGRSFGLILERLVRNNGVVVHRYAPDGELGDVMGRMLERYERIALKEGVEGAFDRGMVSLQRRLAGEVRMPLSRDRWERFVGLSAAEAGLSRVVGRGVSCAVLVWRGKHDWYVEEAARRVGLELVEGGAEGVRDAVVGTLSPGPMLDGVDEERALGCWDGVWGAWELGGVAAGAAA